MLGWLVALPVPLLIGLAPSWWFIVAANLLLGVNQGLAWSMTVVMKIDLAGPRRRGLALGLNEAAGYLGVAATALRHRRARRQLRAAHRRLGRRGADRVVGLVSVGRVSCATPRAHVAARAARAAGGATEPLARAPRRLPDRDARDPVLRACSQAGLVNNLNDALAWGLAPLYLAAHGASVREIAIVAAAYPLVWGLGPAR